LGEKSNEELCKLCAKSEKIEQKITLQTRDGLKRKAILTLHKNAKGNVVLCHPAATDKEFMKAYAEELFPNYNTIRFDFRWHGENNENQFTSFGHDEVAEVEAAANIFKNIEATQKLPMYGFGISMGAVALIELEGKKHTFDGLILQSCYEKLRNQIQRMFGFYRLPLMHNLIFRKPSTIFARKKYKINLQPTNPIYTIGNIKVPIFLIHAYNDHFIPVKVSQKLEKAAKKSIKMVWRPKNGKHTTILEAYPKIYPKKINKFLNRVSHEKYKVT
jgi:alpha-beta hydrolase superfamily lysophospholipase